MLASPLALHALGWALLHSCWQALLIAGLVKLALLATASPRWRHLWAMLGSWAVLLTAVATWRAELGRTQATLALLSGPLNEDLLPASASLIESLLPLLVVAWIIGATGLGLYRLLGLLALARLRRRAVELEGSVRARAEQLAARLNLHTPVRFAEAEVEVPLTLGFVRPLVLLPLGWAARLGPTELDAALAHELAHVRRHDYLLNLTQLAIEALFFFHPCVWWLGRVVRREREHACDDLVVEHIHSPATYARALLALEDSRQHEGPGLALALDGAPLLARVQRLLDGAETPIQDPSSTMHDTSLHPTSRLRSLPAWLPLMSLGLSLGLALALPACLEPDAEPLAELESPSPGLLDHDQASAEQTQAPQLSVAWLPPKVAAHREAIEAAAERHGVDPALLAIFVMVESGGDPEAESTSGARGLMQVMPTTAAHIAEARGLELELERLWEPDLNLDFGAWYLARELRRWGEVELAAAAYNGGSGAVEAWVAGEGQLSEETDRYRQLVARLWSQRDADEL